MRFRMVLAFIPMISSLKMDSLLIRLIMHSRSYM
jgi:hypothetical protein